MAVAVHPPRAAWWLKRLRQWLPVRRAYHRLRERRVFDLSGALNDLSQPIENGGITPGLLLRMLVPGWAHWYEGHGLRGLLFLVPYLIAITTAIVTLGSTLGASALGLAFAIHVASATDLSMNDEHSLGERFVQVPFVSAASLAVVYVALGLVTLQFVGTRQLIRPALPFHGGDVIWYNRTATPHPGDIVAYTLPRPDREFQLPNLGHTRQVLRVYGERIERIVAGPGSVVQWSNGQLTVDGQPSELRPLNIDKLPESFSVVIPPGHYGILLSTDQLMDSTAPNAAWQFLSKVPESHITGRVFLRNYPLDRWWWVR